MTLLSTVLPLLLILIGPPFTVADDSSVSNNTLIVAPQAYDPDHKTLPLDRTRKGAGKRCPKTLSDYFVELDSLLNKAEQSDKFKQEDVTSGYTGRVIVGKVDQSATKTYYFQSDFENLNNAQVEYIKSLYTEDKKFAEELNDRYKSDTFRIMRGTSKELGERSKLTRQEFTFVSGFTPLDREVVNIRGELQWNDTCAIFGSPSVSNEWIDRVLDDGAAKLDIKYSCLLVRAQNLYPSGDRLCIVPNNAGGNDVQVIHMVTPAVGGVAGFLFDVGLFSQNVQDNILSQAQKLEDNVNSRA